MGGFAKLARESRLKDYSILHNVLKLLAYRTAAEVQGSQYYNMLMADMPSKPATKKEELRWIYLKSCWGYSSPGINDYYWYEPVPPTVFLSFQEVFGPYSNRKKFLKEIRLLRSLYSKGII